MIINKFELEGLILITPQLFTDQRGFFCERYRFDQFKKVGIDSDFIQDNYSRSSYGTLRGLHYQWELPQCKLVTCTRGRILDVAVDIRSSSPTFGKHISIVLEGDRPQWLWIPSGFAHGFIVLSEEGADLSYKVNALWNSKGEGCLAWNDADLNIKWGLENPSLSEKDQRGQSFAEYKKAARF